MARRFAIALAFLFAVSFGLHAADHERAVQNAIKAGQQYLKDAQRAGGARGFPEVAIAAIGGGHQGGAWLTGLALIESGLKPDDPVVGELARKCRQGALYTKSTYEVS